MQTRSLLSEAEDVQGVKLITANMGAVGADALRAVCDTLRDLDANVAAILAGVDGAKVTFAVAVGKGAQQKGLNAGKLAKEAATAAGGNGGGRPDFAMAGGKKPELVADALAAAKALAVSLIAP